MDRYIKAPLNKEDIQILEAGDYVYITGTIYTARDAAHLRMYEALDRNEALPVEMQDNVIYYMGPSPAREGRPIGSAGPTTASRMDKYAPLERTHHLFLYLQHLHRMQEYFCTQKICGGRNE